MKKRETAPAGERDIKAELMICIRDRVAEITENEVCMTVDLHGITMKSISSSFMGMSHLKIQNIFLDEDGCVCGDFAVEGDPLSSEILFGRDITQLTEDDLDRILNALYSGHWSLNRFEDFAGFDPAPKSESLFKKYFTRDRSARKSA